MGGGALHPHLLLMVGDDCSGEKMANQTALLSFLCSRFSVGSNESRQPLSARSAVVTQERSDGAKRGKEEENGEIEKGGGGEKESKVCS